jgi:transcriptional regulator with PAS, ATPase and Fis domain
MALKNAGGKTIGGIATFNDLTLAHQLDRVMLDRYAYKDMIGKDPKMKKIFDLVAVVSKTDATILIEGETGTGKDLIAKVIHDSSARKKMPFVKVNCAALPDNLLESELFGFMKGAFTGAHQNRRGRFQEADGGTIFLDEIGDLPIGLQAKLLRVIEDKEFYRLGDSRTVKVDVRILSATNRDLKAMTKTGRFREDLLYRLNVFRITLPPLRERPEDLPLLIRHITRRLSAAKGDSAPEISNNAMRMLLAHDYPGNVRELENILQHAMIISPGNRLRASHLPAAFHNPPFFRHKGKGIPTEKSMEKEKSHLLAVLEKNNWNRTRTARELKIHRATLWRKMRFLGISFEK